MFAIWAAVLAKGEGGCLCSLLMDCRAIAAGILRTSLCADNYRQSSCEDMPSITKPP